MRSTFNVIQVSINGRNFTIPGVMFLDLSLTENQLQEGARAILKRIRPKWKYDAIKFKVSIFSWSRSTIKIILHEFGACVFSCFNNQILQYPELRLNWCYITDFYSGHYQQADWVLSATWLWYEWLHLDKNIWKEDRNVRRSRARAFSYICS